MEIEKKCTKCLIPKTLNNFVKSNISKDGHAYVCKSCQKEYRDKWVENNINYNIEYHKNNKEKIKEKRDLNKDKRKEYKSNYSKNNRDKINKTARKRYKEIPHVMAWRRILKRVVKQLGKTKESSTHKSLGYSAIELKEHITSLFTDGMCWDNYGEWHIDHIIMVSEFDSNTSINVVNSLSNLRPLWATTREINGIIYEGNLNRIKK